MPPPNPTDGENGRSPDDRADGDPPDHAEDPDHPEGPDRPGSDAPDHGGRETPDHGGGDDPDHDGGETPDHGESEAPSAGPESVEEAERRLREAGEPFVRATVVRREPPVSATVGSRAVVTADGELVGWIGGVECARETVVEQALAVLESGQAKLIGLAPDPATVERPGIEAFELTCHSGGTLEVFLDPVSPAPELLVVGGSPIAATLAAFAPRVGYAVTVVDPDAGEGAYPAAARVLTDADPAAVREAVGEGAAVVVASVGEFDASGVIAGLGLSPSYLGLVASERRAEEVVGTAAAALGVDPGTVREAVTSPTGIDVGAETPEEIAVSILAELIAVRRRGPRAVSGVADAGGVIDAESPGSDAEPSGIDGEAPEIDAGSPGIDAGGTGEDAAPGEEADVETAAGSGLATDPVCGMEVAVADPAATVEHGGETHYFCSQGCADAFAADPEEYLRAS